MEFLSQVVAWLSEAERWRGSDGIPSRTLEHVQLSALAVACAASVAIPLGVGLGHFRRGGFLALSVVNIGRALPSFAVVALTLPLSIRLGLGLGFWPTFVALLLLGIPPMFTNSYTAVSAVSPDVVEASRGMGMSHLQVLTRVELPLGAPVILASVRVAAVHVLATATLGALVGFGGLGRFIVRGLAVRDFPQVFVGALLVALLCILTELGLGIAERMLLPGGVRRLSRSGASPSAAETMSSSPAV